MNNNRFKFRVWDNINKRYEKDLTLIDKDGDLCHQDGGKYCNGEHPEDFTIEQCTGLTDRNGKLIYEGDVVKINNDYTGEVRFKNGCFVWDWGFNDPPIYGFEKDEMEIIGNIHDDQFREITKKMEG